jgi:hypothetical protein
MPPPTVHPQSDPRVLELWGLEYYIMWEKMRVGSSFFLPTTATAGQVLKALRPVAKELDWTFAAHPRCEFGRYGVRVWRTY